ncbi:MAG: pyridoxal phosphate-dependent aminotransferase [Gammaproteobacteria bacterium]|nr:pyridoxal phosphate-dependent aminotransferase [Gammaproteobacteria bacterium]
MTLFRDEIESLEQNGITYVALRRIADKSVYPLWFGEGDLVTPDFIRDAAKQALDDGFTFYGHTQGHHDLRAAIKTYLDRLYGTDISLERITVPGSTMLGITIAAQMALTSGLHGLIVSPNWPNIDRNFQVTGADFDFVAQRFDDGRWALRLEDLFAAVKPNTKAIFINTPCNPTGWTMTQEEQRTVLEFCRERDILVIADEVYHRNVYGADVAPSFLQVAAEDDPLIVISGFSKAFAMTGWRLGWMVTPKRYTSQLAVMSECFNTSAPAFVQRAGIAALEQGESHVSALRTQYEGGRKLVMDILGGHPRIELSEPDGAFYAFPKLRGLKDSLAFAEGLLDEEDVGVAPGYTFGPDNDAYFRICFALSHDRLEEALRRIVRYIDRHDNELGS